LHDTVIVNPLLCNQNCNQTCCDKKTENKFNQTKCEKCGSTNGKYGNKYSIKNEILNLQQQQQQALQVNLNQLQFKQLPLQTQQLFQQQKFR